LRGKPLPGTPGGSRFDVCGLIALVNEQNGRVILHAVRHSLLQRQAETVGLPLRFLPLDPTGTTTERNAALALGFGELRRREADCVAFGDLFPLWGRDTRVHADAVLEAGLSAWVCSFESLASKNSSAAKATALSASVRMAGRLGFGVSSVVTTTQW